MHHYLQIERSNENEGKLQHVVLQEDFTSVQQAMNMGAQSSQYPFNGYQSVIGYFLFYYFYYYLEINFVNEKVDRFEKDKTIFKFFL